MERSFVVTTAIRKILRMHTRKKIIQGGTSAGKTFGIIPILINRAMSEKNLEISIVSESYPHLRRGAMKDFLKIMSITERYKERQWNRGSAKYTFDNGSYIEFFSVDQSDKLRGARRHVLYLNEANNISFDAYNELSIRTSGEIYIDFNPTSKFWAHNEVLPEPDASFIILTYKDNEALDENTIKQIELAKYKALHSSYWKNWWNVYGLGLIGSLQDTVFSDWEIVETIPKEAKYTGTGLDFGYSNDPTAVIDRYYVDGKIYYDEVLCRTGLVNGDIARLVLQEDAQRRLVYADSAEPKSIAELNKNGLKTLPTVKGRDSINFGIQLMQSQTFYVTARSTNLIKELRNYTWKKNKSGEKIDVPNDAFNHCLDACRYVEMSLSTRKRSVVRSSTVY